MAVEGTAAVRADDARPRPRPEGAVRGNLRDSRLADGAAALRHRAQLIVVFSDGVDSSSTLDYGSLDALMEMTLSPAVSDILTPPVPNTYAPPMAVMPSKIARARVQPADHPPPPP